jgi:hypothetical protein
MTSKTNKTLVVMLAVTLSLSVVAATIPSADAKNSNPSVIPPTSKQYDKHTDAWWQWILSIPTDQNPANAELETTDCAVNQSGDVWFLNGVGGMLNDPGGFIERDCTIPVEKQILFPIVNLAGSETTPEKAEAFNEQLTDIVDLATDLQVTVDGVPLQDLDQYRFKESSAFGINCQAIDLLCLEGEEYAVHEGYFVMLTPLTPGQHTIEFSGTIPDFEFQTGATYNIIVE